MRLALALFIAITLLRPGASAAGGGPALQVTDLSPFTVRGTGFVPGEQVTVVAQVEGRHVSIVVASAAGTFTLRLSGVSLGPCPAYIVQATGNRGSRAYLRSVPECAQPRPAP